MLLPTCTSGFHLHNTSMELHVHRRRKFCLGGGGAKYYHLCAKNLGHAHLIEVQRALMALEGATAVWS